MFFQLPLIPPTAAAADELFVHSESLPAYKARAADVSNHSSLVGPSQGTGDRKPVVAEIKSLTKSSAIQVNDEAPFKPMAVRKGKASKQLRPTKTSAYSSKDLITTTLAERNHPPLYAAEESIQQPLSVSSRQSLPGDQAQSVASSQISNRQERIYLYEEQAQPTLPTVTYTRVATTTKQPPTRHDVPTKEHDVISGVTSRIDTPSTVNLRDHSSTTPADIIQINRPELVTSSKSVHHAFADVINPELQKTQTTTRTTNTQWTNFTENSNQNNSNYSARTEYEYSFSFGPDAANNTTGGQWPETRGEISGRGQGLTGGDVVAMSAGCALCLCVCLLLITAFRYRKRSKEQRRRRRKTVLDDIVNPSLLEEIIRVELARGRVKMYRTAITDTRELERLPLGGPAGAAAASNDQWGTPTMPTAKLHHELPGVGSGASARHSYRPLFSDSPVRIYDLGQAAKWSSADPDLVNVIRPWNASHADGSSRQQSPVRSYEEHLPLKTMSYPGGHPLPVDPVRTNEPGPVLNSSYRLSNCNAQSVTTPFAPFAPPISISHTTVSGDVRHLQDGPATVDSHHRKRFPKMGQSCLLNRRSNNCTSMTPAASTNQSVPRSSVISTVMTSPTGAGQTKISNPGSAQHVTDSTHDDAGSLFSVANGNATSLNKMVDDDELSLFAQKEILWRNDRNLLSHLLQSSPIYANTHIPTLLSRDTAV